MTDRRMGFVFGLVAAAAMWTAPAGDLAAQQTVTSDTMVTTTQTTQEEDSDFPWGLLGLLGLAGLAGRRKPEVVHHTPVTHETTIRPVVRDDRIDPPGTTPRI